MSIQAPIDLPIVSLLVSPVGSPHVRHIVVSLRLPNTIEVPDDSIASIRTAGIIGDRFVKITPGGSDLPLEDGEEIIETESAISIEELISKYMFEGGSE